jgi:hypothetical protein
MTNWEITKINVINLYRLCLTLISLLWIYHQAALRKRSLQIKYKIGDTNRNLNPRVHFTDQLTFNLNICNQGFNNWSVNSPGLTRCSVILRITVSSRITRSFLSWQGFTIAFPILIPAWRRKNMKVNYVPGIIN